MNVLAVIPARAGSKRLTDKNRRLLLGKTLVQWAIEVAQKSQYITELVCSTDSDGIIADALELDCVSVRRPPELATDTASSTDVLLHALQYFPDADVVVLLQPTSPLRTTADIDEVIRLYPCVSVNPDGERNGAVYAWVPDRIEEYPYRRYQMPWERSVDIDTAEDFAKAESLLSLRRDSGIFRVARS